MKPPVTHYITVYYQSGPMTFRGTEGYCKEIRASAKDDRIKVSEIRKIPKDES